MGKEAIFSELINEQRESGLTITDFCSNHGITRSTFHYWKKKLSGKKVRKGFIPLMVESSEKVSPGGSACPEIFSGKEAMFELVYPNGTILRVRGNPDLSQLRTLIHLYD